MSGLGVSSLRLPANSYRPDLRGSRNFSAELENEREARAEDTLRASKAEASARNATNPLNREAAQLLASKLSYHSRGEDPPETPASSGYMLGRRIPVIGGLSKLVVEQPKCEDNGLDAYTATIMRPDWEMSLADFANVAPADFLNPLRMDLYRCGVGKSTGAIFAGLHAEYEPQSEKLRVHSHMVALGDKARVIKGLRKLKAYRPIVRTLQGVTKKVPAVRMSRMQEGDLFAPLSYPVQSFIPSRWEGVIAGKWRRQGYKARIAEPEHTQVLLWFDRWRLEDLTMLIGLRVTKQGLIMTNPGP